MKKIPRNIIINYKNRIMNVHPSLLPKYGGLGYYGIKVHNAVIKSKDQISKMAAPYHVNMTLKP